MQNRHLQRYKLRYTRGILGILFVIGISIGYINHLLYTLDTGILHQYTLNNFCYQGEKFDETTSSKDVHFPFGENKRIAINLAVKCDTSYCKSKKKLEVIAKEGEIKISPILIYSTRNSQTPSISGPSYFQSEPFKILHPNEHLTLKILTGTTHFLGETVPAFLPKKYGTFIFDTPFAICYLISAYSQQGTGTHLTITISE